MSSHPLPLMTCRDAVELLPWLVNGSLEPGEQRQLRAHLEACESCRHELDQTVQAWDLHTRHVPSLVLAEVAQGLPPSDLDAGLIDRHLAACPSCRSEFERAALDDVADFEEARRARAGRASQPDRRTGSGGRRWRLVAAAAGFAAMVPAAALLWKTSALHEPSAAAEVASRAPTPSEPANWRSEEDRLTRREPATLLADGFESGGTAAWSASAR